MALPFHTEDEDASAWRCCLDSIRPLVDPTCPGVAGVEVEAVVAAAVVVAAVVVVAEDTAFAAAVPAVAAVVAFSVFPVAYLPV